MASKKAGQMANPVSSPTRNGLPVYLASLGKAQAFRSRWAWTSAVNNRYPDRMAYEAMIRTCLVNDWSETSDPALPRISPNAA